MQRDLARLVMSVVCLVSGLSGCSFSNSSETISDSISSPFRWSSGSSGSSADDDEKAEATYRNDVSHYTQGFAIAGGEPDAFRSGVQALAQKHGITNWEADELTCTSIGVGLRLAKLDAGRANRFAEAMLGGNSRCIEAVRSGFESSP